MKTSVRTNSRRLHPARRLVISLVATLFFLAAGESSQAGITQGLVAHLRLDGDGQDASSHGNNGIVQGATPTEDRYGRGDSAMAFDGLSSCIVVADSPSLRPPNLTVAAWVSLPSEPTGIRTVVEKAASAGITDSFAIWFEGNVLHAHIADGVADGPLLTHTLSVSPGRWFHVLYTFDDSADYQALCVDAERVNDGVVHEMIAYSTFPMAVGADTENNYLQYFFPGSIDDVRIYDRFFTPADVEELYSGSPAPPQEVLRETFDAQPNPEKWTLSGSAAWDSTNQVIFLTNSGQYHSAGSIFSAEKMPAEQFTVAFDFWIGGGSGADGITFAWVRGPALLGIGGGHLGFYGGLDGYGVKFDTYSGAYGEPENYVAIIEGSQSPTSTGFIYNDMIPEMEDVVDTAQKPSPFHVKIRFDNAHLEMWMSNPVAAMPMWRTKVLDDTIPEYIAFDAHFGFTAGTGALTNNHVIDNVRIAPGFFEDFDDGAADGFTEVGGAWDVGDGKCLQFAEDPPGPYRSWANAGELTEYTLEVDCTALSGMETKVIYAHADTTENYRVDFWLDRSRLSMPAWGQGWDARNFVVEGLKLSYNEPYHVKVQVSINGIKVWVDGTLQHDQPWADRVPLGNGSVGSGLTPQRRASTTSSSHVSGHLLSCRRPFLNSSRTWQRPRSAS